MVTAIIAVLAALLLSTLSVAKASARRANCLSNLRQISLGIRLYAADNSDRLPAAPNVTGDSLSTNDCGVFYKRLMKSYVGLHGASSSQDKVFACPADTFYYEWPSLNYQPRCMHEQPESDYSSYQFSGGNGITNLPPPFLQQACYPGGSAARKLRSATRPERCSCWRLPAFSRGPGISRKSYRLGSAE